MSTPLETPRQPALPDAIPSVRGAVSAPLLTLAIPTYNRASDLELLLSVLQPQLARHPEVDLYISDNASSDRTVDVIHRFQAQGMPIRSHRHAQNVGADANFVSCFTAARGRYFWLCGDDEVILPEGLDLIVAQLISSPSNVDLDILYLSSYTFKDDFVAEYEPDRLQRRFHTITSARRLTFLLNINFTFISGVITNRERLSQIPHESPEAFVGTNLVQLSWTLPLLRVHRRSRILWTRTLASRRENSGGYSLGMVFGRNLAEVSRRLLPDRPDLSAVILNFAVRRWFPVTIVGMRESGERSMQLEQTHGVMKPVFSTNPRYWMFTYPALRLPLPLAKFWVKVTNQLFRLADHARNPFFWRRST